MSLTKDIVNAEIMLTDLTRRAKNEGVSAYTYISQRGELVGESRLGMDSMDSMTFYTCSNWANSETIVMVLGIYLKSEIELAVGEQLLGKTIVTYLDRLVRHYEEGAKVAVYVSMNFGKVESFYTTTTTDGWSGIVDGVKYKINEFGFFINWRTDPLSSRKQ